MTNIGYFIDPSATPLDKINFASLKANGITEVYIRAKNSDYQNLKSYLPLIISAGLKPFVHIWQGLHSEKNPKFLHTKELATDGWHICLDIENYDMKDYLPEIKDHRQNSIGKTFIICTKPTQWDGEQRWDLLAPLCDYIMPMLYVNDYGKSLSQLSSYMEIINNEFPNKIYPALETYESDKNVVPKTNNRLQSEIKACGNVKGIALFRYGLSNYKGVEKVTVVERLVDQINVRIPQKNFLLMDSLVSKYPKLQRVHINGKAGDYVSRNYFLNNLRVRWINYRNANNGKRPSGIWTIKAPVVTPTPQTQPVGKSAFHLLVEDHVGFKYDTWEQFFAGMGGKGYLYYNNDVYPQGQALDRLKANSGLNCSDISQIGYAVGRDLGLEMHYGHIKCKEGGHIVLIKGPLKNAVSEGRIWDLAKKISKSSPFVAGANDYWCKDTGTFISFDDGWLMQDDGI